MSKIKVRLKRGNVVSAKLKPKNGIKARNSTVYLFDPTLIDGEVQLAQDWAIKTDGLVEEDGVGVDYSSKAYAIGGTGTQTNNAKYYAEQAGLSATSASDSATTATTQAGIATTQAGIAITKAGEAATSESNALTYSQNAATSAGNAYTSESNAHASELAASSSADDAEGFSITAGEKATEASGYATSASTSATNAGVSANNAQTWAEGTDEQVSLLGGEKSAKGWANKAKEIADGIGSIYKPAGSIAFESLPALSSDIQGNVYNITNDFTTTSDFVEGAGKSYPAGTNVVCIDTGSGVYKWDVLAGIVDLSGYVPTSRTVNGKALSSDISLTYSDVGAQQAGNYVTTNTVQTITEAKTFTKAVHFTGTGDTNAVFLTENTRFDIEGTTRTILGMGSAQFYINHSAYALLLRGKNARPSYNSATSYLALLSDLDGYVPTTRTVNGKALSSDISLSASDVGALPDSTVIPTVNNPTITLTQGGVTKGSFTLNQSTGGTIDLDAGGGGVGDIDNKSITTNVDDEMQTVGVIDQNDTSTAIKTWTGTKAQYDAIVSKDANTIYNVKDEPNTFKSLLETIYPVGSIYIGTMNVCPMSALFGTWQLVSTKILTDIPATLEAKGNGTSLGLTDGAINGGLANPNQNIVAIYQSRYGTNVGNTSTLTDYSNASKSIGVTTDPTKSGIVADTNATALTVNVWQRTA